MFLLAYQLLFVAFYSRRVFVERRIFDKFSILHTFCIQNAYDQRQSSWRLMKITALRMIVMEIIVFIWIFIQN